MGLLFFILVICLSTYVLYTVSTYFLNLERLKLEISVHRDWLYGKEQGERKKTIEIYSSQNQIIGEMRPELGSHITMDRCESLEWLKKASISMEDQKFYSHNGVSWRGIVRAAIRNLQKFKIKEGAGTITQQLARNIFTDQSRTLHRKIYETLAAFLLEVKLSKEEILCLYLNKIYMGEGRIGAEEASWFYFHKEPENLNVAEAATIVGIFPNPSKYSPLNHLQNSMDKQSLVLDKLVEMGYISTNKKIRAIYNFRNKYKIESTQYPYTGSIGQYGTNRYFRYNIAPSANLYVKEFLYKNFKEEKIQEGGLKIYTTINKKKQQYAIQIMRKHIKKIKERFLTQKTKASPEQLNKIVQRINGVLIHLDGNTGEIQAVVGSHYASDPLRVYRIWNMYRQPGSSIKGFLYAIALEEQSLYLNDILEDKKIEIDNYKPKNWDGIYLGEVSLAQSIGKSINSVAVQTLNKLGAQKFRYKMAETLGLSRSEMKKRFRKNLTLALGSAELSPMELSKLYAVFINHGVSIEPYLITRIEDSKGNVLFHQSPSMSGTRIISEEVASVILELLDATFDPKFDGTASFIGEAQINSPNYLPFEIAGKTGTVQNSKKKSSFENLSGAKDAWFIGMVPGETSTIWIGHDEGAPIQVSGSNVASIWAEYMQKSHSADMKGKKFFRAQDIRHLFKKYKWNEYNYEIESEEQNGLEEEEKLEDLEDTKDFPEDQEDFPDENPDLAPGNVIKKPPENVPENTIQNDPSNVIKQKTQDPYQELDDSTTIPQQQQKIPEDTKEVENLEDIEKRQDTIFDL